MKLTVLGVSTVSEDKVAAGVKVMFGDAEFTIIPHSECKEFKEAGLAQSFIHAEEITKLKKEKEAAKNKKPVNENEIARLIALEAKIEEERIVRTVPLLIKDWKIEEKFGKMSASLIARLAIVKPDAVTGEVGSRVAKYSREAAAALCADRELRVSLATPDGSEVSFVFHEWVGVAAGDEARMAVRDEINVESLVAKFGPLVGK
jgi:hypothetical protein